MTIAMSKRFVAFLIQKNKKNGEFMIVKNAVELTGRDLKDLLAKAVGGIYFGKCVDEFFGNYQVKDDALVLNYSKYNSITIPLNDEGHFINYATAGSIESEDELEEWVGSTYFDYKIEMCGTYISFNIKEKSSELSLEQLKEFVDPHSDDPLDSPAAYHVDNVDSGSLTVSMSNCRLVIDVESGEIAIFPQNSSSSVTIDEEIITSITNNTNDCEHVNFYIEFNNGMPNMQIVPMIYMEDLRRNRLA